MSIDGERVLLFRLNAVLGILTMLMPAAVLCGGARATVLDGAAAVLDGNGAVLDGGVVELRDDNPS